MNYTQELEVFDVGVESPCVVYSFLVRPDGSGCFPFASPAIEDFYGVSRHQLAMDAECAFELIHEDDVARVRSSRLESAQKLSVWHSEFRVRSPKRGLMWLEGRAVPRRETDGSILWHGYFNDITKTKIAEAEALKAQNSFRAYVEHAPIAILIADNEGEIVEANPAAHQMLGYKSSELVTMNVADLHSNADCELVRKSLECVASRGLLDGEYEWIRKDGERIRVSLRAAMLKTGCSVGFCQDVTAVRQTECDLRNSATRYQLLFEQNPNPMWVYELPTLRFLAVNETAIKKYGYTREQFLSMTLEDIRPPEDIRAMRESALHSAEGIDGTGVWRHVTKDGLLLNVEITDSRLMFDGRLASLVLAHDVSDRERMSADLLRSEAKYREFIECSPLGIYRSTADGQFTYVNPSLVDLLRCSSREDLLNRNISDFYKDPTQRAQILASEDMSGARDVEADWVRGDSQVITVRLFGRVVRDSSDKVSHFEVMVEDVTESRILSKRLSTAAYALSAYADAAIALLEARTPLSLMEQVCEAITKNSPFRFAWVGIAEHDPERSIRVLASAGVVENYLTDISLSWSEKTVMGRGPSGIAIRTGAPVIVDDCTIDERFAPWRERAREANIVSLVSVPFQMEDHTAVVSVYSSNPHAFGAVVVEAFQHLAKEISVGVTKMSEGDRSNLERQKREAAQRDLAKALDGVIGAISAAMETRDPYTAGHQRRVAAITSAIAREMKWSEDHVEALRLAALVHDIGKIAIPAEILTRPTGLREAELLLMKEHPETGYQILKDIPFDFPVAEMVRQHHERMDGSGYPRGLIGDEIIMDARILAVADVLEATASQRPYRAARGFEAALAEIERQAGTQLDVDAVRTCVSLCRAGKLNLS